MVRLRSYMDREIEVRYCLRGERVWVLGVGYMKRFCVAA